MFFILKWALIAGVGFVVIRWLRDDVGAGGGMLPAVGDEVLRATLRLVLPAHASSLVDAFTAAANKHGLSVFILLAIGHWESNFGKALDANGKGDSGHGHGIMQIDDRTWGEWLATHDWRDPMVNIDKGAEILKSNYRYFENKGLTSEDLAKAAVAAYNGGPGRVWTAIQNGEDPDTKTTGKQYGAHVLSKSMEFYDRFTASLPA